MSAERFIDFDNDGFEVIKARAFRGRVQACSKKPPQRVTVAPENKILVSREEASQMLSISQRALDYLVATKRLAAGELVGGF